MALRYLIAMALAQAPFNYLDGTSLTFSCSNGTHTSQSVTYLLPIIPVNPPTGGQNGQVLAPTAFPLCESTCNFTITETAVNTYTDPVEELTFSYTCLDPNGTTIQPSSLPILPSQTRPASTTPSQKTTTSNYIVGTNCNSANDPVPPASYSTTQTYVLYNTTITQEDQSLNNPYSCTKYTVKTITNLHCDILTEYTYTSPSMIMYASNTYFNFILPATTPAHLILVFFKSETFADATLKQVYQSKQENMNANLFSAAKNYAVTQYSGQITYQLYWSEFTNQNVSLNQAFAFNEFLIENYYCGVSCDYLLKYRLNQFQIIPQNSQYSNAFTARVTLADGTSTVPCLVNGIIFMFDVCTACQFKIDIYTTKISYTSSYSTAGLIDEWSHSKTLNNSDNYFWQSSTLLVVSKYTITNLDSAALNFVNAMTLGYPFCTVTGLTETTAAENQIIHFYDADATADSDTVTRTFQLTFKVDDKITWNDSYLPFCLLGLKTTLSTTLGQNINSISFDATGLITVQLSLQSTAKVSTTITIYVQDKRNQASAALAFPFIQTVYSCEITMKVQSPDFTTTNSVTLGNPQANQQKVSLQFINTLYNHCMITNVAFKILLPDGTLQSSWAAVTFNMTSVSYPVYIMQTMPELSAYFQSSDKAVVGTYTYRYVLEVSRSTLESVPISMLTLEASQVTTIVDLCPSVTVTYSAQSFSYPVLQYYSYSKYYKDVPEANYLQRYNQTITITNTLPATWASNFCGDYLVQFLPVTSPGIPSSIIQVVQVSYNVFNLTAFFTDTSITAAKSEMYEVKVTMVQYPSKVITPKSITVTELPCKIIYSEITYNDRNQSIHYYMNITNPQNSSQISVTLETFSKCNNELSTNPYITATNSKMTQFTQAQLGIKFIQATYSETSSSRQATFQVYLFSNATQFGDWYEDTTLNLVRGSDYNIQIKILQIYSGVVQSFSLNSTIFSDNCKKTTILKSNQQFKYAMLVASVLGPVVMDQFMEFEDSFSLESEFYPQDGVTACGPRNYTIVEQNYGLLKIFSGNRTISFQPLYNTDLGFTNFTLKVSLAKYPEIKPFFQSIFVIAEECVLSSVVPTKQVVMETYKIGVGPILYSLNFKQTPACNHTIKSINIISQTETLGRVLPEEFIEFGQEIVRVNIGDVSYYGYNLTFKLQTTFNDTGTTQDETQLFNLMLKMPTFAEIKATNKRPFFEETPMVAFEVPCPDSSEYAKWTQKLPRIQDPQNQVLTLSFIRDDEINDIVNLDMSDPKAMNFTFKPVEYLPLPNRLYYATFKATNYYGLFLTQKFNFKMNCQADIVFYNRTQQLKEITNSTTLSPPKLKMESINNRGEVVIAFSQKMYVPSNFDLILNGTFRVAQSVKPCLELTLIPFDDQDRSLLGFTWSVMDFQSNFLKLDLNFNHSEAISTPINNDLNITVWCNYLFISSTTNMSIAQQSNVSGEVPRQLLRDSKSSIDFSKIAQASLWALISSLLLSFILKKVLDSLLGLVRSLSIITHLTLIVVQYPENVSLFFNSLFELVTFELFQTEDLYPKIFKFTNMTAYSPEFDSLGYNSQYIIMNLGIVAAIILFLPVIVLVTKLLQRYFPFWKSIKPWNIGMKIDQFVNTKMKQIKFSETILFVNELYLLLAVTSFINIQSGIFKPNETPGELFNSCYVVMCTLVVAFYPVVIFVIYYRKMKKPLPEYIIWNDLANGLYDHLPPDDFAKLVTEYLKYPHEDHINFMETYGILLEDLNPQRNGLGVTFLIVQLNILRRLILAAGIVFLSHKPLMLIILANTIQLCMAIVLLYFKPYAERTVQFREGFNEVSIIFVTYSFFYLTDFVQEPSQRILVGNALIGITAFNMLVNLLQAFVFGLYGPLAMNLKKKIKMYKHQQFRKRVAKIKKREEQKRQIDNLIQREIDANLFPPVFNIDERLVVTVKVKPIKVTKQVKGDSLTQISSILGKKTKHITLSALLRELQYQEIGQREAELRLPQLKMPPMPKQIELTNLTEQALLERTKEFQARKEIWREKQRHLF